MRPAWFLLLVVPCAIAFQRPAVETARHLLAAGDEAKAVSVLQVRIKAAPGDVEAHILLGSALAVEGNRNDSIAQLVEAVRLAPESAPAYNALGSVLSRFAELKPARSAFLRAVELDPNFAEAHVNLALALAREDDASGAIEQFNQAIAIEGSRPEVAYPLYLRAKIYNQGKDFGRATPDLEKATALRPSFIEAWSALGMARKADGDEAGALKAFERAAVLNPLDASVQYQVGSQYLVLSKSHQAVQRLLEANRLKPGDRSTLYNLQRALSKDGRAPEADRVQAELREVLRKNEALNATSLEAVELNNAGVTLEKSGDYAAALKQYRAALELDPSHDGFRLNYGLALCRLGQWEQGIAELRDVSERNPDNAEAARALYIALEHSKTDHAKVDQPKVDQTKKQDRNN